ncbi:type-F conjugative transfer system secretin TraK [Xenorhabdus sp. KJ12.1]|uniref:TraK domain-containing protein n=1 Tax=Xenorhabdus sp. KJ12.1 TaxID=1851571 RepID=UPI000C0675C5|nr:type-F conjugative transfer system secretin TraK [Xenorhabdus sp. KJ12.1]PHM72187.1 conjugal transfer protein TraK [Xenorhabdus sp. KJ12.1]
MKLPVVKLLAILVSSVATSSAVAEVNSYGIPFAENSMGEQQSGTAKNTLTVDEGLVLGNSQVSNEPVVVSADKTSVRSSESSRHANDRGNNTVTAGANRNDNPAVDGSNIQPVPNKVVQPIRLTSDVIPSRQEIIVEPGVNTLIPISMGQINRIVTPFERPTVQRLQLNDVTATVKGNVIYVYTSSTRPVALYISEKGNESVAISLSLIPQRIAPVQATLMLSRKLNNAVVAGGTSPIMYGGNETKAKKWEQKDSYVETIRNILRAIALGDLPPGYALGTLGSGVNIPNCNFSTGTEQDNIRYSFKGGQYINGSQFSVIVGVAQNTGPTTVTVDESLCTHPQMAGRALWSRNTLEPGQKTEAYFVLRNGQRQVSTENNARPKLTE